MSKTSTNIVTPSSVSCFHWRRTWRFQEQVLVVSRGDLKSLSRLRIEKCLCSWNRPAADTDQELMGFSHPALPDTIAVHIGQLRS